MTLSTEQPTPPYVIPQQLLRRMVLTLPRPSPDAPASTWHAGAQDALDKLGALNPRDPIEAMLAVDVIALNAAQLDACRLAFEPAAPPDQALRQRANAVALHRSLAGTMRMLDRLRRLPAAAGRDWGNTAAELTEGWRHAPSRPTDPARGSTVTDATPATVVRWIDEIDDAELQIAVEQERREKAGEPPLPKKPGEPHVLYRYKPEDYIHKFSPDPRNWQKYPGFENMTMAERRDMFGYTYTGPNGPPEALTPASRDAMLAQLAIDELLKAEYGM